jgi:hypothetical protein
MRVRLTSEASAPSIIKPMNLTPVHWFHDLAAGEVIGSG